MTAYKKFSELSNTDKQCIASAFLDTQITYLQNEVVEYILEKSIKDGETPFSYDDITNYDYYGTVEINEKYHELTEEERDEKLELYEYLRNKTLNLMDCCMSENGCSDNASLAQNRLDNRYTKYVDICDELENMDFDEEPEIYQWFLCSDYLLRQLERKGECTLNGEYWGRQCCGQSLVLDHVIQVIAYEYFTTGYIDNVPQELIKRD